MHLTQRQIDLINNPALGTATIGNIDIRLVQRKNGEFVAGAIQRLPERDPVIIDIQSVILRENAYKVWLQMVSAEAGDHMDFQPAQAFAQS